MRFFILATLLISTSAQAEIKGYSCTGTEPFFSLEINGNKLEAELVGAAKEVITVSKPLAAVARPDGYVVVYKNTRKDVNVTIISEKCSDGMSDTEYAAHLVYTKGNRVLEGCCEPRAQD